MQLYFEANNVVANRKVAVLLSVIGAKAYETLHSLLVQVLHQEKSFEQLLEVLTKHFDPQLFVISERFCFYQRSQKKREWIMDFISALRRLSIRCEFGTFLDQA